MIVGCFGLARNQLDHNQGVLYSAEMSIRLCKAFCAKFAYLWLQKG
jgi:hypothetical protein